MNMLGNYKLIGTIHLCLESRDRAVVRVLTENAARVRFRPGIMCGLSVLAFSPEISLRVSSLHKTQHSKFQFNQDRGPA